jgi:pimeloyl-ACP methyl ester carboxylesterase
MSSQLTVLHVNGVDLNVVDIGTGAPVLVFLHYWGGSSRTWAPVMEQLATTNRCVAIDFRGWGRSSKDCNDYSLDTLATDVIGVVEKLDLKQFLLIGHSMGGKVAQLVAARQPAGLQGLILYAPAPPNPLDVPEADRRGYINLYQSREGAELVIGNLTPHTLPQPIREQIIEDTLRGSAGAKEAWPLQGMIADIRHETSRITVPLCIIAGGDDRVESEASLREAFGKVLHGVRMVVIPGVGHIAPLEAPAKLANAIRFAHAT